MRLSVPSPHRLSNTVSTFTTRRSRPVLNFWSPGSMEHRRPKRCIATSSRRRNYSTISSPRSSLSTRSDLCLSPATNRRSVQEYGLHIQCYPSTSLSSWTTAAAGWYCRRNSSPARRECVVGPAAGALIIFAAGHWRCTLPAHLDRDAVAQRQHPAGTVTTEASPGALTIRGERALLED